MKLDEWNFTVINLVWYSCNKNKVSFSYHKARDLRALPPSPFVDGLGGCSPLATFESIEIYLHSNFTIINSGVTDPIESRVSSSPVVSGEVNDPVESRMSGSRIVPEKVYNLVEPIRCGDQSQIDY